MKSKVLYALYCPNDVLVIALLKWISMTQEITAVQLENVHKGTSQQPNIDWLRKQHMMRRQLSLSPSPPHSSTSSSPEFQMRTIQGWQVLYHMCVFYLFVYVSMHTYVDVCVRQQCQVVRASTLIPGVATLVFLTETH